MASAIGDGRRYYGDDGVITCHRQHYHYDINIPTSRKTYAYNITSSVVGYHDNWRSRVRLPHYYCSIARHILMNANINSRFYREYAELDYVH